MALVQPLRYDSQNDVRMRLNGTIVRWRTEPIIVSDYGEDLLLKGKRLSNGRTLPDLIHSSDEDLDISSPPLGYLNYNGRAYYVQRIPIRKQLQGFHPDVATIFSESASDTPENTYSLIKSKHMADTIKNIYPNGYESLQALLKSKNVLSIAFHRRWALVKDELGIIKLRHNIQTIGWFPPKKDYCILSEELTNPIYEKQLSDNGIIIRR